MSSRKWTDVKAVLRGKGLLKKGELISYKAHIHTFSLNIQLWSVTFL